MISIYRGIEVLVFNLIKRDFKCHRGSSGECTFYGGIHQTQQLYRNYFQNFLQQKINIEQFAMHFVLSTPNEQVTKDRVLSCYNLNRQVNVPWIINTPVLGPSVDSEKVN